MPFNIELTKPSNVAIKIQVVKKMINIYFNGKQMDAAFVREKWIHLGSQIVTTLPHFSPDSIIALADSPFHLKQEHTNSLERTIFHAHIRFQIEVTPVMFATYLNAFYKQQMEHDSEYQFFRDRDEVDCFIQTFTTYYKSYKGSAIESLYNECSKLNINEQEEHDNAINKKSMSITSNSVSGLDSNIEALRNELRRPIFTTENLLLSALLVTGHPVFGNGLRPKARNTETFDGESVNEFNDCPMM